MKIKSGLFILTFCFAVMSSAAQEVISAAGGNFSNQDKSISWTLGELAIQTLTGNDLIITQGFHQSYLTVVMVDEFPESNLQVSAWPNPTTDHLKISIQGNVPEKVVYELYDISGSMVFRESNPGNIHEISFNSFEKGVYFLRVLNNNQLIQTLKIVKH